MATRDATYPPLDTLKRVCDDVWIVDGPLIRFGMPWPKFSFPTRMTVIRLGSELFIHSPTPLPPRLRAEIEAIGTPRWLIGPNRLHYWWIGDWKACFPAATAWLAPRIEEQAGGRIGFDYRSLDRPDSCPGDGYPWDGAIDTLPVAGSFMTEMVFFHRPSRTLVLADLVENFEAHKVGSRAMRWLVRLAGAMAPDGQMPRDLRVTFARQKEHIEAAVACMLAWQPERVIFAHGRWFETEGTARLRHAFRWVL